MYPKFIEVHEKETGDSFFVNVDHINSFGKEGIILTGVPRAYALATAESYDDLKALITDVGCLIHKADPRLDMSRPLTLDDLKDMVGEPVWNSNVDVWMLVKQVGDTWARMLWRSSNDVVYTEDDLIKYPVYRMRRA